MVPLTQAGGSTFESVSVTPSKSEDARGGCCRLEAGGGLAATNATLRQLNQSAYQRHAFDSREIEGGPSWIDSERFDLVARASAEHVIDPDGLPRQTWLMLRTLLADRFKLRMQVEGRARPVYALVKASGGGPLGPRLHKSEADCAAITAMYIKGQRPEKPACSSAAYPGRFVATALTLASDASLLSGRVDRALVDETGLTGTYDLELEAVEIRPPGPFGPSFRPSDTKESIFEAMPRQLGLKLEPREGTVDVLVIDGAEPLR